MQLNGPFALHGLWRYRRRYAASVVPYQQTWPALAQRKRNRAEKLERLAAQSRAEADELDRRYAAFDASARLPESVVSAVLIGGPLTEDVLEGFGCAAAVSGPRPGCRSTSKTPTRCG